MSSRYTDQATSSVSSLHEQQLLNGHNNNHNISQILNIIGGVSGIDKILSDYLSATTVDQLKLNQSQLHKISELQTKNSKTTVPRKHKATFNRHKTVTSIGNNINTDLVKNYNDDEFYYTFYENDTILHSYFGKEKATKIISIFHSKIIRFIVTFTYLAYLILVRFSWGTLGTLFHAIYSISCSSLLWIPYCLYLILSANKKGLRLIIHTFEFWFRISVSVCHFIAIWLDLYILHHDEWKYFQLAVIERVLFGITFTLVILNISCFDAMHISTRWNILFSSLIAFNATLWSTWMAIVTATDDDEYEFVNYEIIQIAPHIAVSLSSIQISTMRVLAIFIWRQAFVRYWRKQSGQSVLIKQAPFIIWNVRKQKQKSIEQDVTNSNYDGDDDDLQIKTPKSMTKEMVKKLHQQQLQNNGNNKNNTKILVDIIGGIDKILSDYLNNDPNKKIMVLNEEEILMEIYELIKKSVNTMNIQKTGPTLTNNAHKQNADTNNVKIYYFFDETNTFLHHLCSANIANKMLKYSKYLHILAAVSMLMSVALRIAAINDDSILFLSIKISIIILIFIPYSTFILLTINKEGFIKFIIKSFEFWLKAIYGIVYMIAFVVDNFVLNADEWKYKNLVIIETVSFGVALGFAIISIASFDVIKLNRFWKIVILTSCAVMGTAWTVFLMFISFSNKERRDGSVLIISSNLAISLLSLETSAVRIITIFIWKQVFQTIYRKNKASLIQYFPYIKWYINNNNSSNTVTSTASIYDIVNQQNDGNVEENQSEESSINGNNTNNMNINNNKTNTVISTITISHIDDEQMDTNDCKANNDNNIVIDDENDEVLSDESLDGMIVEMQQVLDERYRSTPL